MVRFTKMKGGSGSRVRILIVSCVALAALAGSLPGRAQISVIQDQREQVCTDPDNSFSLFAKKLRDGRIGYGRTRKSVQVPGPTLTMYEGECLQVTLVNDTDRKLGMHAHGVAYTVASDGTPLNNGCVRPGKARTYTFEAPAPATRADGTIDPGSAGYFHYHDHCMGGPHGTGGIRRGLYGAFIVRRQGDPIPKKKPVVLVMNDISFNNRIAPRTPMPTVDLGERVEFVVIGHGDLFHTFHLHGHRWADNRGGFVTSPADTARIIDNKTVGPADSFGFQIVAGEHVGPGAWMYHCHVQTHSDLGMEGMLVVRDAEGRVSREARAVIREFKAGHRGSHDAR